MPDSDCVEGKWNDNIAQSSKGRKEEKFKRNVTGAVNRKHKVRWYV